MKRLVCLVMVVALTLCCSVAFSETMQDAFLCDLLAGIRERLSTLQVGNETVSYFQSLADIELKHIGKYTDEKFNDERFDTIAHQYIDACRMQSNATKLYPSALLWNTLWDSGANARSALIIELYERYGLALTQDEMLSYYLNFSEIQSDEPVQPTVTSNPAEPPLADSGAGNNETEKASQEEKGNIIVVKKPDEEEHDYSLATGFFVGGYNMVADEMLEGKYKDRLTIRPLRVSDFGEHKDISTNEIDKTALAYKGSKNGEPIKLVLSFDENEDLKSANLAYGFSNDSSSDYGSQTQMTNIVGYTEAVISGFDSDLDYERLAEEIITGLINSEVGALDGHQYKIKENGVSVEAALAFGVLVIIISR